MPMQEVANPVGVTSIDLVRNNKKYAIEIDVATFDRAGEDGDIPILPLSRGCEFIGDILPGEWRKGWDADISVFTASIDGGNLELTGVADVAGVEGAGWINSNQPVPLMDKTQVVVSLESPTDDTGAVATRGISLHFYLLKNKVETEPNNELDFIDIRIDVQDDGLLLILRKRINGAAAAQIFTGSTYDDATGRDTGDLEGCIFTFVFHDGVAGADSPGDVRHMHVYLKQSDTIANAENANKNELTTSPYDISDLEFDVAYPAYQISTEHATYFGTAIGSANAGLSGYLRVDYPQFKTVYNQDPSDFEKGEVEIWDGDPDSGGIQVFDEDHDFSGDPYLQNGLHRVWVDEGTRVYIYYWNGAAWTRFAEHRLRENIDFTNMLIPYFKKIVSYSTERTTIELKFCDSATDDDDYYWIAHITLEKGKLHHILDFKEIHPFNQSEYNLGTIVTTRFGYVGDDAIGDADLAISGANTTMTDNFGVFFDDDGNAVLVGWGSDKKPTSGEERFRAVSGTDQYIEDIAPEDFEATTLYVYGIPFPLIANLFEEAEDVTLVGGATVVGDGAASGGQAVLLNAQNEYAVWDKNPTVLPEGRYLCVVRARDINQIANDFRMFVDNLTSGEHLNEENTVVVLFTCAATYGYFSVVFDIREADLGDRILLYARKQQAAANEIYVDYFLIIPIGDGANLPQDLAHAAMRSFRQPPRISVR